MRKRQEGNTLATSLVAFVRSLTLTRQEQAMAAAILLSLVVGGVVKYCRREYRVQHPIEATPAPRTGN